MDNRAPEIELEEILASDPGQYVTLPELNVSHEGRLSRVRKSSHQLFTEDLTTIRLIQLANSLVEEPNEEMVKRIIAGNVELLKHVFPNVPLTRRNIVNATPLQLVYFAGDHHMCETLKPFFTELCGSEEAGIKEMERQIQEKMDNVNKNLSESNNFKHRIKTVSDTMYPGCHPVLSSTLFAEIKKVRKDFRRNVSEKKELNDVNKPKSLDFKPIIEAISNDAYYLGHDPATNKRILSPVLFAEIKKFQTDFHRSQARVIDKGVHFKLEVVQELLETYHDMAKNQWGYDYKKCALLEDAVLAWVLGYVSENDAQSFNQGLYYLQKEQNPEPFARKQKTRDGYNFYEALKRPSIDFLGLNGSCVDIVNGWGRVGGDVRFAPEGVRAAAVAWKSYVEQKLQAWRAYAATPALSNSMCNFVK